MNTTYILALFEQAQRENAVRDAAAAVARQMVSEPEHGLDVASPYAISGHATAVEAVNAADALPYEYSRYSVQFGRGRDAFEAMSYNHENTPPA